MIEEVTSEWMKGAMKAMQPMASPEKSISVVSSLANHHDIRHHCDIGCEPYDAINSVGVTCGIFCQRIV